MLVLSLFSTFLTCMLFLVAKIKRKIGEGEESTDPRGPARVAMVDKRVDKGKQQWQSARIYLNNLSSHREKKVCKIRRYEVMCIVLY